ncbi:MAG: hypothetical protein ACI8S6_001468 [Myxococcota bacterium]|jgi:hypothetical protein
MGETVATRVRRLLAESGGIASCHYIAEQIGMRPRAVRDRLKRAGDRIVSLGAGYFALKSAPFAPLVDFAEYWVQRHGPQPIVILTDTILDHYPRGHRDAVRRWLQQEPGRLQRRPGTDLIERTPQRWKDRTP